MLALNAKVQALMRGDVQVKGLAMSATLDWPSLAILLNSNLPFMQPEVWLHVVVVLLTMFDADYCSQCRCQDDPKAAVEVYGSHTVRQYTRDHNSVVRGQNTYRLPAKRHGTGVQIVDL
jgi:hypothetical protein